MFDPVQVENESYRHELAQLRQLILRAEPAVLLDGRFESMIVAPVNVIKVAHDLIVRLSTLHQTAEATGSP